MEVLATTIREEKEVKLPLFSDDIVLYIENSKDATRKLLDLINEFSKVAGYKINTQKSVAFLYTNNERSKRESNKTIPFTIHIYNGILLSSAIKKNEIMPFAATCMDLEVIILSKSDREGQISYDIAYMQNLK